ncbi:type VII secretion protein EccE [Mycobacterium celatum]|uniref:Type VII secretion protein EccE n=1 Tax=Mycobacterium celatum TaxID=28045 RepID=A0A1X1RIS9_MYCCE|nr:type VII secretion protein EccE [Mycobacterium celatum]ORV07000.1 type VII secretion protein EccE [Mycobacterium celatum]PIB78187.1 type VII secretion protein EccE [Mycobacterium celatum]
MTPATALATATGVLLSDLVGWAAGGYPGAAAGLVLGILVGVVRWRRRPLWSWAILRLRQRRPMAWTTPATVANDRAGGGIRYQDGVAVAAVQVLGKPHTPTLLTACASAYTENTLDISELQAQLRQSLGLTIDSLSVVSAGARRRSGGDYPRVYDTLVGAAPYAGRRETWIILRVEATQNAEALRWRKSLGTATLGAAQRISNGLRQRGIRARLATATEIVELERRLGRSALDTGTRRWSSVRSDIGWLTTYCYQAHDIIADNLAQAWATHADGIIQNITLFADGSAAAAIAVLSTQPPRKPPSRMLRRLPGEQLPAVAANLCGPRPELWGLARGPLHRPFIVPIGATGVLLGKVAGGSRLAVPFADPAEFSRVHIAADDNTAKRIVIRIAGTGERITIHTRNLQRWASVRMPDIALTDQSRPVGGTTVSVADGTVVPSPRPSTLVTIGPPGEPCCGTADVVITQAGPMMVEVRAAGQVHTVEIESLRAETRYVSPAPACRSR